MSYTSIVIKKYFCPSCLSCLPNTAAKGKDIMEYKSYYLYE